jgi:GDPmannose 4,6-dehydratase
VPHRGIGILLFSNDHIIWRAPPCRLSNVSTRTDLISAMNSTEQKRALICGVNGQDGAYLSRLLLKKGYRVFGTSRDAQASSFQNLKALGISDSVDKLSMAPADFRSVIDIVSQSDPHEIYYLAGQTSVSLSFNQPAETLASVTLATLNILEALRIAKKTARFYHASSSECFGDVGEQAADESSPFKPRSPYGIAKTAAHSLAVNYRDRHGLFACNGILFNHESPLRPARFVTRKIVDAARAINAGSEERLRLGRLDVIRDWGWGPEYVEAIWLMLQAADPDDYVIATGHSYSLEQFTAAAFASVGLEWRAHVDSDPSLFRTTDIVSSRGNPAKAACKLGWRARYAMTDVVRLMIEAPRLCHDF